MKLKHFALGGTTALALVALASPSLAQRSPYTTNPTPEERAQTSTLNAQQAADDGTASNGQTGTAADAQYNAQRKDYDAKRQRYEAQQERYLDQRAQYHRRLAHYEFDRRHSRDWWYASYEHATLDDVYHVPRHDLIGKEVDERDGLRIGHVRDVERSPYGRVERIQVALGGDRVAWIDAPHLRYDADDQVMFTDIPADDIYDRSRDNYYDRRP